MSTNPPPDSAPAKLPNIGAQLSADPAWEQARNTYLEEKAKLKGQDLELISGSNSPEDLASFLEKVEQNKGLYASTVELIRSCASALKERESAINTLASAGGPPGTVAWGTIKMALFMIRAYTEEFTQLLKILDELCNLLKPILVDVQTFKDSKEVQDSLVQMYLSIIKFWEKAIVAHTTNQKKRHRIIHIGHALWRDLEGEVAGLRRDIERQIRIFLVATGAAHHKDTKERTTAIQEEIAKAARISRQKTIAAWLGPPMDAPYGNDFYEDDLNKLLHDRHPQTCQWIFQKSEFWKWKHNLVDTSQGEENPALWIAAGPGAGKSILTASIVQHLQQSPPRDCDCIFYYFIIGTDKNKSSVLSITKAILFQMYVSGQKSETSAFVELETKLENAATKNLRNADMLWKMVLDASYFLKDFCLVIDAVDECDDFGQLLSNLGQLHGNSHRLLITGRPADLEEHSQKIAGLQRLDIQPTDALPDMKAFLESKSEGAFHPSRQLTTVDTILRNAHGMFLWVSLISRQLEAAGTEEEIKQELGSISGGLYDAYDVTLQRMIRSMSSSPARLKRCRSVLQWLCICRRPLRPLEIFGAMTAALAPNDVLFKVDGLLRDCGSFVAEANGVLSLSHFTVREYLLSKYLVEHRNREVAGFWVDISTANFTFLQACVSCLVSPRTVGLFPYDVNTTRGRAHVATPSPETMLTDPRAESFQINEYSSRREQTTWDAYIDMLTETRRARTRRDVPFLEYATTFWLSHLHSIPVKAGTARSYGFLQPLINSYLTLWWIELFLTFNPGEPGIALLQRELSTDMLRIQAVSPDTTLLMADLATWKSQALGVIRPMTRILSHRPEEVRFLDARTLQQYLGPELNRGWENYLAEKVVVLDDYIGPDSWKSPGLANSLNHSKRYLWAVSPESYNKIAFFCYHQATDTYIYATESDGDSVGALLFCQDRKTGQPLPPFVVFRPQQGERTLVGGAISKDGRHIGLHYATSRGVADFALLEVRDDRRRHTQSHYGWISRRSTLQEYMSSRDGPAGKLFCFVGTDRFLTRQHAVDLRTGEHSYRKLVAGDPPPNARPHPVNWSIVKEFVVEDGSILQQVKKQDLNSLTHISAIPGKTVTQRLLKAKGVSIITVSPEGKYAALRSDEKDDCIVLHRIANGHETALPLPLLPHHHHRHHHAEEDLYAFFVASSDGRLRLVAAFGQRFEYDDQKCNVCVWDMAAVEHGNVTPTAGANSPVNATIATVYFYETAKNEEVYLVSRTRSWIRFGLDDHGDDDNVGWRDSTSGLIEKEEDDPDSTHRGYVAVRFSYDMRQMALASVVSDVIKVDLVDVRGCRIKDRYVWDLGAVEDEEDEGEGEKRAEVNKEEEKKEQEEKEKVDDEKEEEEEDNKDKMVEEKKNDEKKNDEKKNDEKKNDEKKNDEKKNDTPRRRTTRDLKRLAIHHSPSLRMMWIYCWIFYLFKSGPEAQLLPFPLPESLPTKSFQRYRDTGRHALSSCSKYVAILVEPEKLLPRRRQLPAADDQSTARSEDPRRPRIQIFHSGLETDEGQGKELSVPELPPLAADEVVRIAFHPSESKLIIAVFSKDAADPDRSTWKLYSLDMDGPTLTQMSSGTLDFAVSDDRSSRGEKVSDPVFGEDSIYVYYTSNGDDRSRVILHGYLISSAPGPDHQQRRLQAPSGYCGGLTWNFDVLEEIFHYEYHLSMPSFSELNLRNYEVCLEIRTIDCDDNNNKDEGGEEGGEEEEMEKRGRWDRYIPLSWRTPQVVAADDDDNDNNDYRSRWRNSTAAADPDADKKYSVSKYFLTTVPAHLIGKCHVFVLVWSDDDDKPPRFRVVFVDNWTGHVEVKSLHLTWRQFIWDLDDYFHPPDDAHRKFRGYIPRGVGREKRSRSGSGNGSGTGTGTVATVVVR